MTRKEQQIRKSAKKHRIGYHFSRNDVRYLLRIISKERNRANKLKKALLPSSTLRNLLEYRAPLFT